MISFRTFMVEYLTDTQHKKFAHVKMSDKARTDTDHHFGKDNDIVHGELAGSDHHFDKSEIHKEVEHHIGKELTHDEYKSGLTKDKYGRDAKVGKAIKDEKIRNKFASDKNREGSKMGSKFTTTTVRGTEVAGQTNSSPNKEHPNGHSWGEHSCKNVEDGSNKHYLPHEIKHGTVVHRVHDHNGQEIYRAALQPHHAHTGTVYDVNSEYGIKHPSFTKSSHEVAKKLSTGPKEAIYKIHPKVYNDKHISNDRNNAKEPEMLHPGVESHHIDRLQNDKDAHIRVMAGQHHNATDEHITKGLNDESSVVRSRVMQNPNAKSHHLDKGLKDSSHLVRVSAAAHPNATKEHLEKASKDQISYVRKAAERS